MELFGKYLLLERLASGGMGEVFLAKSGVAGFERYFAVKRILAHHADNREFINAIMDEAKICIGLTHSNIAQVFEFGNLNEHFFLVMEYVEGLSLSQILQAGAVTGRKLTMADAVYIAMEICRALDYAHDRCDVNGKNLEIVHRDVSPSNVLLDQRGSPKLIDFGVAKAAGNLQQTEAGFIKGKLGYMSPEQARGEPLDRRADIYSLGIVLYEAATYTRLFAGNNTFTLLRKVQDGDLSGAAASLPTVPAVLQDVLRRALERERDKRYPRASEMERDLAVALRSLDPAYTPQGLARLIADLDTERGARAERLRKYSELHVEGFAPGTSGVLGPDVGPHEQPTDNIAIRTPTGPPKPAAPNTASTPASPATTIEARRRRKALWLSAGAVGAVALAASGWLITSRPTETALPPGQVAVQPPTSETAADGECATLEPSSGNAAGLQAKTTPKRVRGGSASGKRSEAKPGQGCVSVIVDPWAYVLVKGERVGTTPIFCVKLPAGKHMLLLSNPALGKSKNVSVTVEADKTVKVIEQF